MSISADGIATLPIFYGRADRDIFSFTVLYMCPYISFYTDMGMDYISELLAHISVYDNGIDSPCPCGGFQSGCSASRSRNGHRATIHLPFLHRSHLSNHSFVAVRSLHHQSTFRKRKAL